MKILGISCYFHDGAAALVDENGIVAAAEEERFTRVKHDFSFPEKSISYCLNQAQLDWKDIDAVAFYEKPIKRILRMVESFKNFPCNYSSEFLERIKPWINGKFDIEEKIRAERKYKGDFYYLEHHLSHAASAYYPSPFNRAAVLTVDGVGEKTTTSLGLCIDNNIKMISEIHYPDSLGLLYSTITSFLGFKVNNDEYKVMGLSSYGNPKYKEKFDEIVRVDSDGFIKLNLEYFSFQFGGDQMYSNKFTEIFGKPRIPDIDPIEQRHADIAATLQVITENALIRMTDHLYNLTGEKNLCMAGGVALNSVANWRIATLSKFSNIFIQPAAGDSGGALGAALFALHQLHGVNRQISNHSTLLGPSYSNHEIEKILKKRGVDYFFLSDDDLYSHAAILIHENNILGWFQGRMEFGPRALGSRSILANPCNPEMKDILNRRVKFREDFRPFAPAVLEEKCGDYFDILFPSPYMLFVAPVKESVNKKIPSVTHIDNTARIQTVSKSDNPKFYRLIEEFEKLSGVPILINTSFNVNGEPIVCTPEDALNCFLYTDIDYLIIGNYLVGKEF